MSTSFDFSTHGREINTAYTKIVTGDDSITWAIFSPDNSGSYKPEEQGDGDINEFVEGFQDTKVEFGLIRVTPPGSDVKKLLLIGWCPDSVSIKQRSQFAQNFGSVSKTLHGYHVQVTARDRDDLDTDELMKKVSDAAGARYLIQLKAPSNFGGQKVTLPKPSVAKPAVVSKPAPVAKPFSGKKTVPVVGGISGGLFIPKPIVPKPVAPLPKSPFFGAKGKASQDKKEDDGWDGADEIEERDFSKKPLETVKPAWKPIGKVNVDELRQGTKVDKPKPISGAHVPVGKVDIDSIREKSKEEKPASTEDLDDDEKAFLEKKKLFSHPNKVPDETPTEKPSKSSFKPSTRPGTKVPLPQGFQSARDNLVGGASKNFGSENGKTPAQLWAEKKGKYTYTAPEEPQNDDNEVAEKVSKLDIAKDEEDWEKVEKPSEVVEAEKEVPESSNEAPAPKSLPPRNLPPRDLPTKELPPRNLPPRDLPPRNLPEPVAAKEVATPVEAPEAKEEPEESEELEGAEEAEAEEEPVKEEPVKAGGVRAKVNFDYEPQDEDEINLVDGEIVTDIIIDDEDWWFGKNSKGESGQFPSNYVELIEAKDAPATSSSTSASAPAEKVSEEDVDEDGYPTKTDIVVVAEYDYDAQEENELTFAEGDVITNVHKAYEDWYIGSLNGERKWLPANFVKDQE